MRARGTGETTRQMKEAPKEAMFVWVSEAVTYPTRLARMLGRTDLRIVGPSWITECRWKGDRYSAIVLDHASRWTEEDFEDIDFARGLGEQW